MRSRTPWALEPIVPMAPTNNMSGWNDGTYGYSVAPRCAFGRGRWRIIWTIQHHDGTTSILAKDDVEGCGYPDGTQVSVRFAKPGRVQSITGELMGWEPDPQRLVGVSSDALAPFLASSEENVRLSALRALAFVREGTADAGTAPLAPSDQEALQTGESPAAGKRCMPVTGRGSEGSGPAVTNDRVVVADPDRGSIA